MYTEPVALSMGRRGTQGRERGEGDGEWEERERERGREGKVRGGKRTVEQRRSGGARIPLQLPDGM